MEGLSYHIAETAVRALVVVGVHVYFYRRYRDPNLAFWAAGWACYDLGLLVSLVGEAVVPAAAVTGLNLLANLASGALLLRGTLGIAGRRLPRWAVAIVAVTGLWVIGAMFAGLGFTALALPPSLVSGGSVIALGLVLLKGADRSMIESKFAGVVFLVWGLHKLDYPFLRTMDAFAQAGYIVAGALSLTAAAALIVAYVNRLDAARRTTERRFKAVVDSLGEAVITADVTGNVIGAYGGWFRVNGYPAETLVGRSLEDILDHRHDAMLAAEAPRVLGGETRHVTLQIAIGDAMRWFTFTASPLYDRHRSPVGIVAVGQDINELVESRNEIAGRLEENRVLLQEIHHRVKNNMQIMASLLSLQAPRMKSPEDRGLIEESSRRIETMAYVHEQLYSSGDMSHIAMGSYIVELAERLAHTYDAAARGITIVPDVEEIKLGIERAVPCAQIVHETVTNALKHGFENDGGEVRVALRNGIPNRVTLVVEDTGRGMSPPRAGDRDAPQQPTRAPDEEVRGAGQRGETLGLKLVELLTRQLDGQARFESDGGTRFTLVFPKEKRVG